MLFSILLSVLSSFEEEVVNWMIFIPRQNQFAFQVTMADNGSNLGVLTMMSPFSSWAGSMAMRIRLGFSGPTLLRMNKKTAHYTVLGLHDHTAQAEKMTRFYTNSPELRGFDLC